MKYLFPYSIVRIRKFIKLAMFLEEKMLISSKLLIFSDLKDNLSGFIKEYTDCINKCII